MESLDSMIGDVGKLMAGCQTVKSGKTLREAKPTQYAPQSPFGTWLENLVTTTIKQTREREVQEETDRLIGILKAPGNEHLIPVAQDEVEKMFVENFGAETMKSNARLDKVLKNMKITKLCVIAKESIDSLLVDKTKNTAIAKVLKEHNLI